MIILVISTLFLKNISFRDHFKDPFAPEDPQFKREDTNVDDKIQQSAVNVNLGSLSQSQGLKIVGASKYDNLGYTVANAGDINGDGIDDILISSPYAFNGAGATYVIYGSPS